MDATLNTAEEEPADSQVGPTEEDDITFTSPPFSYVTPKAKLRRNKFGIEMIAADFIAKDEVVIGWSGRVVHVDYVRAMDPSERTYILQIDEQLFQVPFWPGYNEKADFTNHSCDPSCGFGNSPVSLVAMRDLKPGDPISFDYAMSECIENLEGNCDWDCLCGSKHCRGKFRGDDWKRPELHARYGDYFSPYLRRKIAAFKAQEAAKLANASTSATATADPSLTASCSVCGDCPVALDAPSVEGITAGVAAL